MLMKKNEIFVLDTIGRTAILFVIVGIYFSLLVEAYLGFTQLRNLFYVIGVALFGVSVLLKGIITMRNDFFQYALLSIPIAFVSVFFWESLKEFNVYVVLITLILVVGIDISFLKKILKYIFYLSLILALYEYIFKDYVFVVYRQTIWGLKALDPHLYGGYSGLFRAKAIFEGPLALAQLSIGMALLFKNDIKIIIISILLSFLANGRLAILLTTMVLGLYVAEKYGLVKIILNKKVLFSFLILFIIGFYFIINLDEKSMTRLLDIFNTSKNSTNSARLDYWKKGYDLLFTYDFKHLFFGNSGYYKSLYLNNAENGWLTLLLNNGLLGFFYYLFPLAAISFYSAKNKTYHLAYVGVLFIAMIVQTFHLGASASLFYWVILYTYYDELKLVANVRKDEIVINN